MTDYFNYECVGQLSLFDNYNIHKAETFTFDDIKNNTNILSVFDGMACGMLAFLGCGFNVKRYVAYEIDSYAVKTTQHNFPFIEHKGDVFNADFTEYADFDFLVGGSPCTYWSIAQTKNRETIASGMGWELFQQYVRALKEAKPKFFIYENNKSMSKQIRESITETFGFQPICINSALVSAQTRNRLYWVGIRNGDGSYRKANIQQPKERGILVQNILETKTAIPLNIKEEGKSQTLKAQYAKNSISNFVGYTSTYGATGVAEPVRVGSLPSPDGVMRGGQGMRIYSTQGKAVSLKGNAGGAGGKTGLYAIPVEQECLKVKEATSKGYTLIEVGGCVDMSMPNSKTRRGRKMDEKSNCLQTSNEFYQYCGTLKNPLYEVVEGMIVVSGKHYPIKLVDGYYIIRKLTVTECMRLQTVPEWYQFPVSNNQAYKMLGNGWTVEVIKHLISSIEKEVRQ